MAELELIGSIMKRMFKDVFDPAYDPSNELSHEPQRYKVVRQKGCITLVDNDVDPDLALNTDREIEAPNRRSIRRCAMD